MDELNQKITVKVCGQDVILDPSRMKFNENTLSQYLQEEYSWFDYFGKQLELAEKELAECEMEFENLYSAKYIEAKDEGNPDGYCKSKAQIDPDVVAAHKRKIEKKATVGLLKSHIKAWDKNHANANNRGHTLRKEMEKLNSDIMTGGGSSTFEDYFSKNG